MTLERPHGSDQTLSHAQHSLIKSMPNAMNRHVTHSEVNLLAGELQHQITMLSGRSTGERIAGKTIWATQSHTAAVYWDWVLTDDGSPVLANPFSIRSNLRFQGDAHAEDSDDQLLGINQLVNALPWQREVLNHLKRLRVPTSGIQASPCRRLQSDKRRGPAKTASYIHTAGVPCAT